MLLAVLLVGLGGCRPTLSADSPLPERVLLVGSGASFPALIYQSWFIRLNQQIPALRVNYQSLGSGAGVEQFSQGTVDFGASDVAMTDAEIAAVDGGVRLLPMTAGSIGLVYNLPGEGGPKDAGPKDAGPGEVGPDGVSLRLSRSTYTDIFLGRITRWDDPAIAITNPRLALPPLPITVVHRADGSGTTAVLTQHLSAISDRWHTAIGTGKSVDWPDTGTFVGAKGNEGVTTQVLQTPGALGYVDYSYAITNDLAMAALENRAGEFVAPTPASAQATLEAVPLPANLRRQITDPPGAASYPLVTYTWLLVHAHYDDPLQAQALEMVVEFGLNQGQTVAPILGYVPLPMAVRQQVAAVADGLSSEYHLTLEPAEEPRDSES